MGWIIFAIVAVFVLFVMLGFDGNARWRKRPRQVYALSGLIVLAFGAISTIGPNTVGIVYDPFNGGIQDATFEEGFQLKSIFSEVYKISTTNKTALISVAGQTKDSIYATFSITLIYKIAAVDAGIHYRAVGIEGVTADKMNSIVKTALQATTTNYDVYSILGESLEAVRLDFVDRLAEMLFEQYHVTLISASFDDIDAGDQIEQAIQNKAQALQEVEIAEVEQQQAIIEAATALIRANNAAEVQLITAAAQAEAQIILNSVTVNAIKEMYLTQFAEGEDTTTPEAYNYLTMQEISAIILKQLYYDTWDGVLPTVIADGSSLIINP